MNELIQNIEMLHTTPMGVERIKRNLSLEVPDVVEWCRNKILDASAFRRDSIVEKINPFQQTGMAKELGIDISDGERLF